MADENSSFFRPPFKPDAEADENHFDFFSPPQRKEAPKPTTLTGRVSEFVDDAARGLARGAIGVPGAAGSVADLVDSTVTYGAAKAAEKAGLLPKGKTAEQLRDEAHNLDLPREKLSLPRSEDLIGVAEKYVPWLERRGGYTETAAEMIPGALIGPGGMVGKAVKYGVAPGLATEATRQFAPKAPPWAAPAAGVATAIMGGLHGRPTTAQNIVSSAARGLTAQQLDLTERLMQDAAAMGMPLTRSEAAQAVTNGATRLGDLLRVTEGQRGMPEFFAQRPGQIETAGRRAFDQIGPRSEAPSTIGPAIAEAADQTIGDTTAAINDFTRPLYRSADNARVGQAPVDALIAFDPLYARALREVRNDPALNRQIEHLPDDSPTVMDLVQRRLRERADNAEVPGQARTSNLAAANYQQARDAAVSLAERASPEYAAARQQQEALRRQYLEPLMSGPIGKLAKTPGTTPDTTRAINSLFPAEPKGVGPLEIWEAVSNLRARNLEATQQLVRAHIESVFDQARRDLQSGPPQQGGATFVSKLVGNPQQRENLAAAISALPNGPQILAGFNRMLEVMAATGRRQPIGSQTAFNQEAQLALKEGSLIGKAAALGSGLFTKLPAEAMRRYEAWNIGNNVDEIARLLTDPRAEAEFRALANAPSGSARAAQAVARLAYLGQRLVDNRKKRASGGRVGKDYPAKKMSRFEKDARRAHLDLSEELRPMMDMPDHEIVNALRLTKG